MSVKINFDLYDTAACRFFGQALLDYSNSTELETATPGLIPEVEEVVNEPVVEPDEPTEQKPSPRVIENPVNPLSPETPIVTDEPAPLPTVTVVVDMKGVPFNPEHCGEAGVPFYSSGKRNGQWKKKRGGEWEDYDEWYLRELAKIADNRETPKPAPKPDTAQAFAGDAAPEPIPLADPTSPATPVPPADVPGNAGDLMAWLSEQQTGGHIDQAGIDAAYAASGFTPGDLFSGADGAVSGLFAALQAQLK